MPLWQFGVITQHCRPRVGMGWFVDMYGIDRNTFKFSSPSVDGVVPLLESDNVEKAKIFVPEWGWVGSSLLQCSSVPAFIFVPAWGWVGSANAIKIICHVPFSSPSGDGLVHEKNNNDNK